MEDIRLGYACINTELSSRKVKVSTNRTMRRKTFDEKGYYGYSDHAMGIVPALQSYLNGSQLLEKHFTFNNFNQRETEKANLGAFTPDSLRLFKNLVNEFNIIKEI